jgi:hypothetical protein
VPNAPDDGATTETATPPATDEQAPSSQEPPSPPSPPSAPAVSSRSLNIWTFLTIAVVMAALVVIIWKILDASTPDSTVAVLGVVIPMFATVGAAVFGIPIAYQRGTTVGAQQAASTKDQEVAAASDSAKKEAEAEMKTRIEPVVENLADAARGLVERVRNGTESPVGTDTYVLTRGRDDPIPEEAVIPSGALTDVEKNAAQLEALVKTFGS